MLLSFSAEWNRDRARDTYERRKRHLSAVSRLLQRVRGDDGTLIVLDCSTGAHGLGQVLLSAGPRCDGHLMITTRTGIRVTRLWRYERLKTVKEAASPCTREAMFTVCPK
jgi:hypothetical protein